MSHDCYSVASEAFPKIRGIECWSGVLRDTSAKLFFRVGTSTAFQRFVNRFSTPRPSTSLTGPPQMTWTRRSRRLTRHMTRAIRYTGAAGLVWLALSGFAWAQTGTAPLYRVFL